MVIITKIECDGCDKEKTDREDYHMRIYVRIVDPSITTGDYEAGPFDLCNGCLDLLKQQLSPPLWVRCHPSPPFPPFNVGSKE